MTLQGNDLSGHVSAATCAHAAYKVVSPGNSGLVCDDAPQCRAASWRLKHCANYEEHDDGSTSGGQEEEVPEGSGEAVAVQGVQGDGRV